MNKRSISITLIIAALAIFANFIWLVEVVLYIGWSGTQWLGTEHLSIFLINGFTILAYCFPFWLSQEDSSSNQHRLKTFLCLYITTLIAYFLMRSAFYSLYWSTLLFFSNLYLNIAVLLSVVFYVLFISPFILSRISHRLLKPLPKVHFLLFFIAFVLVVPLSMVSVHYIPGYSYGTDWIDSIKMGYPFFWIIILMGIVGAISKHYIHLNNSKKDLEDILDV